MSKLIQADFHGDIMQFRNDGWFNATVAAAKFGREPYGWLRQRENVEYTIALADIDGNSGFVEELNKINELSSTSATSQAKLLKLIKKTGLVKTKAGSPENGGGTWLHPDLAVVFARWLDVRFAVWCDKQINQIIRGTPEQANWKAVRHDASVTFKVMCDMLNMARKDEGKETESHHYANEARLVNWAFCGEYVSLDRSTMSNDELDLIAKLEKRNAILIAKGLDYDTRKQALLEFVDKEEMKRIA